jgi:hypothetical protein
MGTHVLTLMREGWTQQVGVCLIKSRDIRLQIKFRFATSLPSRNPFGDIAGTVASITESDPGVESERASHSAPG